MHAGDGDHFAKDKAFKLVLDGLNRRNRREALGEAFDCVVG